MLNGALVLIAEDQPIIALTIAFAVTNAGGEVAGPVASVREALALIASTQIDAAILDVNLTDGDITPVAEALFERKIPMVLQSGVGLPPGLAVRACDLNLMMKPYDMSDLINSLVESINKPLCLLESHS